MSLLVSIPAGQVRSSHLEALHECKVPEYQRLTDLEVMEQLWANQMHLWAAGGDGLLLTEVCKGGGVQRLCIIRAVGRELLTKHLPQLVNDLRRLAKDWDCEAVESVVYDRRLAYAMGKAGARAEAVLMLLEVDRGNEY